MKYKLRALCLQISGRHAQVSKSFIKEKKDNIFKDNLIYRVSQKKILRFDSK